MESLLLKNEMQSILLQNTSFILQKLLPISQPMYLDNKYKHFSTIRNHRFFLFI